MLYRYQCVSYTPKRQEANTPMNIGGPRKPYVYCVSSQRLSVLKMVNICLPIDDRKSLNSICAVLFDIPLSMSSIWYFYLIDSLLPSHFSFVLSEKNAFLHIYFENSTVLSIHKVLEVWILIVYRRLKNIFNYTISTKLKCYILQAISSRFGTFNTIFRFQIRSSFAIVDMHIVEIYGWIQLNVYVFEEFARASENQQIPELEPNTCHIYLSMEKKKQLEPNWFRSPVMMEFCVFQHFSVLAFIFLFYISTTFTNCLRFPYYCITNGSHCVEQN